MTATRLCPGCQMEMTGHGQEVLCPLCAALAAKAAGAADSAQAHEASTAVRHGPAPELASSDLAVVFPQLEIGELLGRGGMGAVYKARQTKLGRYVALKILPPDFGKEPTFAARFEREARALALLNHPGIVAIYDFGDVGALFYFLMEYVDGGNLWQLQQAARPAPEEVLRIVAQICDALQYAHEEGVIHRDIKPQNILLDRRGRVKIADFGLAKLFGLTMPDRVLTASQQLMGTLHYMAPEQME